MITLRRSPTGLYQSLDGKLRIFFRGAEYFLYIKIYENFRIEILPWNSLWTWYFTALGVDFCYYWVHRANHEIHFLWAQHQVHHSSEEFNLVVGLRQSVLQQWCSFVSEQQLMLHVINTSKCYSITGFDEKKTFIREEEEALLLSCFTDVLLTHGCLHTTVPLHSPSPIQSYLSIMDSYNCNR
uniref:Agmo_0 protein n=1 Tax=Fopius arisanus TaxID=64838 RepID=A0A0C9RK31_9HYME